MESGKYEYEIPYWLMLTKHVKTAGSQERCQNTVGTNKAVMYAKRMAIAGEELGSVQDTSTNNNTK